MESKPAGDLRSPLDPVHSGTMAKKINPHFIERTCERNFRGISADLARIERLKEANRMMCMKNEGSDYPFWINDLYYSFLLYITQD